MIQSFQRLSVFLLVLALIASIVAIFTATRRTLAALATAGWDTYVNTTAARPFKFLTACVNDELCSPSFFLVWRSKYPVGLLAAVTVLFIMMLTLTVAARHARQRRFDPATGRWSTPRDLKRRGYLQNPRRKDQRGYVGMHPSGKMIRVPENIRFSHGLVLGGPGARKSTGYHWQNILIDAQDGVSVIIFDLKFPDPTGGFVSCLPYFEKQGYDVYAFTPYDKHTHHLPLIEDAVDEMVAREIAEMLIPPSEDGGASYYRNTERSVLAGLLMHAAYCNISLTELHSIVLSGPTAIRRFMNGSKGTDPHYKPALAVAVDMVGALLHAEAKDQQGLARGIEGKLQFFSNANLGNATRPAPAPWLNIPLDQIGKKKSLLYVGVPQKNVDGGSGKLLLQLIKRMIDSALSQTAYENHGKVPNPVSFYLDEFPSFGRLPNVESNFATMRSRQVAYHLTIQNISQGKAIYTDAGFKSFFTSNFQTIMLFPSFIKFEDAEYISKILGNTMTTMRGEGQSRGGLHDTTSLNERESTRPLVTIDEMQTWPANEAIVILNGVPHTRVIVPGIWEATSGGVRNPFKQIFDSLDQQMNVGQYVQGLIERSKVKHNIQFQQERRAAIERTRREQRETSQIPPVEASPSTRKQIPGITLLSKAMQLLRNQPTPIAREAEKPSGATTAHVVPASSTPATISAAAPADQQRATSDPHTPAPVATGAGETVIPRDAINKLVSHIATVKASVTVEGDKRAKQVEQLTVPTEVINNIFRAEQVAALIEAGYFIRDGHNMRVNLSQTGILEESRAKFLLRQLPDIRPGKNVDFNRARNAFHRALTAIMDEDLELNVEANGRTRELQRVSFNPWAPPEDLRDQYQEAWLAHGMMTLKDSTAYGTRRGLGNATPDFVARLLALYDAKRGSTPPSMPATPVKTNESSQPAQPHDEPQETAPSPQVEAGTPQPAPAPAQKQTAASSSAAVAKRPRAKPAQVKHSPTPPREPHSGEARPQPVDQALERFLQASSTPPTSTSTHDSETPRSAQPSRHKPEALPSPPVPQAPPSQEYEWRPHPNPTTPANPEYMLVPLSSELRIKLRNWITTQTAHLLRPGQAPQSLSKGCVGSISDSEYTLYEHKYRDNEAQPPLPPLPPGLERRLTKRTSNKAGAGASYQFSLKPSALKLKAEDRELRSWLASQAHRVEGHPDYDEREEPLQGLTYTPSILTLEKRALDKIVTEAVEPKYARPSATLPLGPVIHVLIPDDA